MNVTLDSNIFIADKWLRSRHVDALLDYLERTKSTLLLHEVVIAEVKAKVRQQFEKSISAVASEIRSAERIGVVSLPLLDEHAILVTSMRKWELFFDEWVSRNGEIVLLDNDLLPEITRRAIHRIPPFTSEGEEFRDALIWLGVLRHASKSSAFPDLAFISQNSKQFGAANKVAALHPSLVVDAQEHELEVHYFLSLEAFIASKAVPIAHLTQEWIDGHLDGEDLRMAIRAYLYSSSPDLFIPAPMFENRYQPIEIPAEMSIAYALEGFFVWQATDGSVSVFLSVDVSASGEAECESLFSYQARLETEQDSLWRELPCHLHRRLYVSADLEGDSFTQLTVEDSEALTV
jgi:hypothetical protein